MDNTEKIRQLEQMLAAAPDDALACFLLGREYAEAGRHEDAAGVLERCVQLNPAHTAAYRFWGDALRKAGDTARAREVLEAGIGVADETGELQSGREMAALLNRIAKGQ